MEIISRIWSHRSRALGIPPRFTPTVAIRIVGLFLLSRVLVLAVASISRLVMVPGTYPGPSMNHSWIGRFTVWDSNWYLDVVKLGYSYNPTSASSIGFYPLYPLLIRAISALGIDPALAGYLISHVALAVAAVLCWKLAALEFGSTSTANRAVMFLLFNPGTVWFGMVYTESLFILTMVGCMLAARQRHWITAGLWGLAAALTRTPGVLLAGFLFLEALQQWYDAHHRPAPDENLNLDAPPSDYRVWRPILAIAGPILGQLGFMLFQQVRFGDWRAQQKTVMIGWNTQGIRLPWRALTEYWQNDDWFHTVMSDSLLCVVVLAGVASFFVLKRASYGALVLALVLLYTSSTTPLATPRYLSTMIPVYLVLSQLASFSSLLETTILVFSTALLTLLTALLVNGYIIG